MRYVMLGTVKIRGDNVPVYPQLINWLDTTPADPTNPGQGFTAGEIRRRSRAADLIEAAGKNDEPFVALEDKDWEVLKEVANKTQFQIADRSLLNLLDLVENAPDKKPKTDKLTCS